tara:strand:+ start:594 stop:794 length:201 start_codon:yes stop_codon:yes gene_type:complete
MTIDRTAGIDNIKKMIDHFETLDKQELIERLTLAKAQLLASEKEIDRLAEERDNFVRMLGDGDDKK